MRVESHPAVRGVDLDAQQLGADHDARSFAVGKDRAGSPKRRRYGIDTQSIQGDGAGGAAHPVRGSREVEERRRERRHAHAAGEGWRH